MRTVSTRRFYVSLAHARLLPASTIALNQMRCDLEYSWAYFFKHNGIFTMASPLSPLRTFVPLTPCISLQTYMHGWPTYHCPELDKLKRTCQALRREDERFHQWAAERKRQVTAIKEVRHTHTASPSCPVLMNSRQHAALCRKWQAQRAAGRAQELHAIRLQRLTA